MVIQVVFKSGVSGEFEVSTDYSPLEYLEMVQSIVDSEGFYTLTTTNGGAVLITKNSFEMLSAT